MTQIAELQKHIIIVEDQPTILSVELGFLSGRSSDTQIYPYASSFLCLQALKDIHPTIGSFPLVALLDIHAGNSGLPRFSAEYYKLKQNYPSLPDLQADYSRTAEQETAALSHCIHLMFPASVTVLVTGSSDDEIHHELFPDGRETRYFGKPFTYQSLNAVVNHAFESILLGRVAE